MQKQTYFKSPPFTKPEKTAIAHIIARLTGDTMSVINAGDLDLDFFFESDSKISASSQFGLAGTVETTTPKLDLASELLRLPESLLSATFQLADRCAARVQGDFSSFIAVGAGGVPIMEN